MTAPTPTRPKKKAPAPKPRTAVMPPPNDPQGGYQHALADGGGYRHVLEDGVHTPTTCPACLASLALREQVNTMIVGHPLDTIVELADFLAFVAMDCAMPTDATDLDDATLVLRHLSVFSLRIGRWALEIQAAVQHIQGGLAPQPKRTM